MVDNSSTPATSTPATASGQPNHLAKVRWIPRQQPEIITLGNEAPLTGSVEFKDSDFGPDKPDNDDVDLENDYTEIAVFDWIHLIEKIKPPLYRIHYGTFRFYMDNDGVNSAAPGANITQPDPNNKYIAVWNDEDRICYYRCYALPSGMGWHNFVMFRRNWMFKRDFVKPGFAIAISFEFRRVTDDDGVPLMFYGITIPTDSSKRRAGYHAKMRDNPSGKHAEHTASELYKIRWKWGWSEDELSWEDM